MKTTSTLSPEPQFFSVAVKADQAAFISVYDPIKGMPGDKEASRAGLSFMEACVSEELYEEFPDLWKVSRRPHLQDPEGPQWLRAGTSHLVQVLPTGGRRALDQLIWERQVLAALNTRPDFIFYGRNLLLDLQLFCYESPARKGWALGLKGIHIDVLDTQCPALRGFY